MKFDLVSVVFILVFAIVFYQVRTQNNINNIGLKANVMGVETQTAHKELPVHLTIPSINVDAVIEEVGITPQGIMSVPKKIINVGWFMFGPRPGEVGSAVIAGHINGVNGKDSVFSNLNKLKNGDKLFVKDVKGNSITFVVIGSRVYDPGYAEDIFSRNDGIHLNLITCDGVWDGVKKSYSKRLVVFTDIVN